MDGLVVATALSLTTPYPLPAEQANVCGRLIQGSCPLDPNEDAVYHVQMPILPIYPLVDFLVEVTVADMTDNANSTVSCFTFNGQVVAA